MFLYHPDTENIGNLDRYGHGWKAVVICGANELPKYVTKYMTMAPIMAKGRRRREFFMFSHWMVLDYDKECMTLDEAIKYYEPYIHCIGTTRSHQKAKSDEDPARDRYRVILKLIDSCHNVKDYEETVKKWVKETNADTQAMAASQPFRPCKEIVSVRFYGKLVDVVKYVEPAPEQVERRMNKEKIFDDTWGGQKRVPHFIQDWLKAGCPSGKRNTTCFKMGSYLSRCGFEEDEIVRLIMTSPIPKDSTAAVMKEVRDAVRSGISRGKF